MKSNDFLNSFQLKRRRKRKFRDIKIINFSLLMMSLEIALARSKKIFPYEKSKHTKRIQAIDEARKSFSSAYSAVMCTVFFTAGFS